MKVSPPAICFVLTLALQLMVAQVGKAQAQVPAQAQTPMLERIRYGVPFSKVGSVTVERSKRPVPFGAHTSDDLIPDDSVVSTGEDGAVSLMLGESAEAGTMRLGAGCEVRLPLCVYAAPNAKTKTPTRSKPSAKAKRPAVRSAADGEDEGVFDLPEGAAKHSLELHKGSLFLNLRAGRLTGDMAHGHNKRHGNAEVVVLTPKIWVAAGVAQLFCSVRKDGETVGVLVGEAKVREAAATAAGLTLKAGQAVDFRDGRFGDVRTLTEEERTKGEAELARAMLKSVPLDIYVQSSGRRDRPARSQGWSREPKAPEAAWQDWKLLHSSFDFWSNDSQLTNEGTILTRLPLHEWRSIFRYGVHVREGEPAPGEAGAATRPEIAPGRLKAVVFQMRILNAQRLIYHGGEEFSTGEHVLFLDERAEEWQDYHLPLTDASSQGPNKRRGDRDGWDGLYMRFDPYQVMARPPVDQIVFEMRDFRALVAP